MDLGVCNRKLGRYAEAAVAFKEAIRLEPSEAIFVLGADLLEQRSKANPEGSKPLAGG